jgi:hypothetical protein
MNTWTIKAIETEGEDAGTQGVVATLHGVTRGEALARGCEAIADGWAYVTVESTFRTYALVDPAAPDARVEVIR